MEWGWEKKEGEKSVGSVTNRATMGKQHAALKDWTIVSWRARNWSGLFTEQAHESRTLSGVW